MNLPVCFFSSSAKGFFRSWWRVSCYMIWNGKEMAKEVFFPECYSFLYELQQTRGITRFFG